MSNRRQARTWNIDDCSCASSGLTGLDIILTWTVNACILFPAQSHMWPPRVCTCTDTAESWVGTPLTTKLRFRTPHLAINDSQPSFHVTFQCRLSNEFPIAYSTVSSLTHPEENTKPITLKSIFLSFIFFILEVRWDTVKPIRNTWPFLRWVSEYGPHSWPFQPIRTEFSITTSKTWRTISLLLGPYGQMRLWPQIDWTYTLRQK